MLEAADGHEALALARARIRGRSTCSLTDVVMPALNGRELAKQVTAVRSETKVLYMSGYTRDAVVHEGGSELAFLQKPFTPDSLARRVRDAIHAVKVPD